MLGTGRKAKGTRGVGAESLGCRYAEALEWEKSFQVVSTQGPEEERTSFKWNMPSCRPKKTGSNCCSLLDCWVLVWSFS